ncbi:protein Wnt-16-like [Dendronephthya gigantea]|uniref:protein Wnt-16-like n=1 Tax=Dendronephthya gigantea TaxID=151771 RepID=UPI00106B8466|nr:protein Wnt-16-like [Dendronephthya gigantea]
MKECKKQLSKERWDCATMTEATALKGLLAIPSKETAFVYALTSAAVVYAVTKSCTAGDLPDCACQKKPVHKYYGKRLKARCDENIQYGMMFAELFVDAPDNDKRARLKTVRRSGQNLVNLHNSRAGRKAVLASVKTRCRCYGLSQGCAMRSCWKVLPKFEEVGKMLKKQYENAAEVIYARRKRKLKRKANRKLRLGENELVYMKRSPNYCRSNPRIGISGTSGRECQRDSGESMNSCALLCCGHGYNTQITREKRFCNCRFRWCCRVHCDTCEHVYDRYTCK